MRRKKAVLQLRVGPIAAPFEVDEFTSLLVVRPIDAAQLKKDAISGNVSAAHILDLISQSTADIEAARKVRAPLACAACPKLLVDYRYSFCLAVQSQGDVRRALCLSICYGCAVTQAGIQAKASVALSAIWPGTRPIVLTHETGGRA